MTGVVEAVGIECLAIQAFSRSRSALAFLSDFETSVGGDSCQSSLNILSSEQCDAPRAEPFPSCLDELLERLIAGIAE